MITFGSSREALESLLTNRTGDLEYFKMACGIEKMWYYHNSFVFRLSGEREVEINAEARDPYTIRIIMICNSKVVSSFISSVSPSSYNCEVFQSVFIHYFKLDPYLFSSYV